MFAHLTIQHIQSSYAILLQEWKSIAQYILALSEPARLMLLGLVFVGLSYMVRLRVAKRDR